jgi:hypothetical protein
MKDKKIKYLKVIQKAGEGIILSSMVGHFVYSNSNSIHISWNFFPRVEKCLRHYLKNL